jgi:ribosomal protein L37E
MIELRERTLLESIRCLWPPYRRRQDAKLKEAIRRLVQNSDEPCIVGGELISNGHGKNNLTESFCPRCGGKAWHQEIRRSMIPGWIRTEDACTVCGWNQSGGYDEASMARMLQMFGCKPGEDSSPNSPNLPTHDAT